MFENVGRKIKMLAKIMCGIGIGLSVIFAIRMFTYDARYSVGVRYLILGVVYLVIGPLVSWISSLFMYGFGELIETNSMIAETNTTIAYKIQNK